MSIGKILWAISIYGTKTRKGIVELRIDDKNVQCSPSEAREFAQSVFEAAEAAETDEFLMHWLGEIAPNIGLNDHSKLLQEYRVFRDSKRRDKK